MFSVFFGRLYRVLIQLRKSLVAHSELPATKKKKSFEPQADDLLSRFWTIFRVYIV